MQRGDPSAHGETEAFRNTGRRRSYRDVTIATTLAPCWYCSGLIRQFGIGTVVVGESRTFQGGIDWLRECGVEVIDLDSQECVDLLRASSPARPRSGTRTSASRCGAPSAAAGSALFFAVAPAMVAGVIPWALTRVGRPSPTWWAAGARARRAC